MNPVASGLIAGLVFGIISVLVMIPLQFSDKRAAMIGSFINRFAIGLVIATIELGLPGWGKGILVGLLLSLPDAIITKSWAPIIGMGAIGGLVIGLLVG
ncbi:hypothetical protein [Tumebacillus permanentifrigoris]|uniref:Uncharacterized protein n=1 Tax=Tumebacillus permanentifrigoris TaxID=378543 RepID=A0A316DWK1_9BACL|nr:hypothetical protein [Tumebacillus permanentifrigoris]PWK13944.1 hypothetical protein C7459_106230 [Tumebacillus permanentifrigoris]